MLATHIAHRLIPPSCSPLPLYAARPREPQPDKGTNGRTDGQMEWTGRRTTRLHVYGESSTTDTSSGVPAGGITSAHASAGICGHLRARHGGPSGMRPPACIGRTNIPAWHAWASIIQPSVHDEPTFKPDHRCGKQPPARPSRHLPHTCHGASLHRSIARTTPCAARPLRLPAVKSHRPSICPIHPSIRGGVLSSAVSPRVTLSCSVVVRRRSSAPAPPSTCVITGIIVAHAASRCNVAQTPHSFCPL